MDKKRVVYAGLLFSILHSSGKLTLNRGARLSQKRKLIRDLHCNSIHFMAAKRFSNDVLEMLRIEASFKKVLGAFFKEVFNDVFEERSEDFYEEGAEFFMKSFSKTFTKGFMKRRTKSFSKCVLKVFLEKVSKSFTKSFSKIFSNVFFKISLRRSKYYPELFYYLRTAKYL